MSYLSLAKGLTSLSPLTSQGGTLAPRPPENRLKDQPSQRLGAEEADLTPLPSLISPASIGGSGGGGAKVEPHGGGLNLPGCPRGAARASEGGSRRERSEGSEKRPPAWVFPPNERDDGREISPPRPDWTDDRAWLGLIARAGPREAKLEALAAWAAAAGGGIVDGLARLPPLRPRHERRLAELELRRTCRSLGVAVPAGAGETDETPSAEDQDLLVAELTARGEPLP
jgi:hypothetical protein